MCADDVTAGRLGAEAVEGLLAGVAAADEAYRRDWPGRPAGRQPVQVLYVPADRVTATTAVEAGRTAADLLARFAPSTARFAEVMGLGSSGAAGEVRERVAAKLDHEPVEDLRIDFEDGYLDRDDAEEDADATRTGRALGEAHRDGTAPPFAGLRVKPFADGRARRSVATLDRFLSAMLDVTGSLPEGFVITFPKIVSPAHVGAFVDVLAALEDAHGLASGSLAFEAQIETTASVLGPDGRVALRDIRDAAAGRLRAVHFGVFDYTAALGLPVDGQRLDHPACDMARHLMQITFAGTEVRLSDGSTNVLPAAEADADLHRVWRRHSRHVAHSLAHGFTQGWDLHASHLVSRYAAVYAHLLHGLDGVLDRLAAWRASEQRGGVADEPATVTVLERRVRQAVECGAIDAAVVDARLG
ncbi:aldolase [Euzebya sp.]|uniref:DUF6986 family protein n=1 Tax=Euzebya sp. TaxID=1971409 RepID=UPI0035127788